MCSVEADRTSGQCDYVHIVSPRAESIAQFPRPSLIWECREFKHVPIIQEAAVLGGHRQNIKKKKSCVSSDSRSPEKEMRVHLPLEGLSSNAHQSFFIKPTLETPMSNQAVY